MKRREFITLLGGVAAWPLAAGAQQPSKIRRIGFLSGIAPPATIQSAPLGGFLEGMQELGYVEGRDFVVEWRFSDGHYERIPALATELTGLDVEVVVVGASAGIRAMQQATKTIPIVMAYSIDPVGNGLVENLARPGGNTTGLASSQEDIISKHVELLKTAILRLSRIAVLINPDNRVNPGTVANAESSAAKAGLTIVSVSARNLQGLESAFVTMAKEHVEALIMVPDSVFTTHRARIAELALKNRLPAIFANREMVELGGLMSYGENLRDFFRRSAKFVDKIFKGAKPAELPIEQPTRFFLVVNLKTAKALGLNVPPALLARSDQVID
ncbi:MAG TPA: ABC transporter substrate-binding protein [Pseudolabrys sp.]|jgi:putative ABC transport system substrate-binding protein|nr:ABC transporter substrate-binding protein [Pseudolabrys sp.]